MAIADTKLNSLQALGGDIAALVAEVRSSRAHAFITAHTTPPASPLRRGNNVFIRTVTVYHVGHIEALTDTEIILSRASWIADTGRFSTALQSGKFNEIEPFVGVVSIARGSVVDVTDWPHVLPEAQK